MLPEPVLPPAPLRSATPAPELLEAAASIGARLCRDAVWHGGRCNWLGDAMEPVDGAWRVVHRSFGPDLYGGTAGTALFLARLWPVTGEPLERETALGALRQALSRRDQLDGPYRLGPYRLGLFSGLTGLALAAAEVGAALSDESATAAAAEIAAGLAAREPEPAAIDVIGGSAGAIPALLHLARRLGVPGLRAAAVRCGDHLLAAARRRPDGALSWDTLPGVGRRDLTGFGHGAAGIAWALGELWAETGDERYRAAALAGVAYEQSCFDARQRNWPDFRDHSASGAPAAAASAGEPICALAWCHGAPGIGLSRVRLGRLFGDAALIEQARVAIETTRAALAAPESGGFSLCHGHAGNAELLILAAEELDEPELLEAARRVGRAGCEIYHRTRSDWPCGVPGGGENPSLMLGVAGIGHFLLRLADPAAVPPVVLVIPER